MRVTLIGNLMQWMSLIVIFKIWYNLIDKIKFVGYNINEG